MELVTESMLKMAENHLKTYLPRSQEVYGCLVLLNKVKPDPVKVFVDRWPDFRVIVCRPQYEQMGDVFRETVVFANDEAILEETIKMSSVIDWTRYLCLGTNPHHMEIFKAVASEKGVPSSTLAVCHTMILEDVSKLPQVDSSGISLSSLDESHLGLVNQMWKFAKDEIAVSMIRNMITHFPSCCVLDPEGKPVSWMLMYVSCAMGMLYTLPEHRGKGYAKVVVSTMAKRLHTEGYPVYCFVEPENMVSYRLFKNLGFSEDPLYKHVFYTFNEHKIFQG